MNRHLLGAESPPNRAMVSSGAFDRAIAGDAGARAELVGVLGVSASSRQAIERLFATRPEFVQAEGLHSWIYSVREDGLSRANEALFRYLQPSDD